jgi:hypothetical protein
MHAFLIRLMMIRVISPGPTLEAPEKRLKLFHGKHAKLEFFMLLKGNKRYLIRCAEFQDFPIYVRLP